MISDFKSRSFATFAQPLALWPPPIALGPGEVASTYWAFKVKAEHKETSVLRAMREALAKAHIGYFAAAVCEHPVDIGLTSDFS